MYIHIYICIYIYAYVYVYIYNTAGSGALAFARSLVATDDRAVALLYASWTLMRSKAFALTWYRALTWYCSPARPFAALDGPLLVTGSKGEPPPRADSFPGLEMRARGAQAKKIPNKGTVPS